MKRDFRIRIILQIILFFIFISACNKEKPSIPIVITLPVSEITYSSAVSGGEVINAGGAPVTKRGINLTNFANPNAPVIQTIDGDGTGSFISPVSGLDTNTRYYVRAYATSSAGTGYGQPQIFTTKTSIIFSPYHNYGKVSDVDGNEYKTITIGTQTWMAENLRTTRYQNYDSIDKDNIWVYKGKNGQVNIFGRLYTGYVATDSRNVCPTGWHVSSYNEWYQMGIYLGGDGFPQVGPGIFRPMSDAGGKLKEDGNTHWLIHDPVTTNESGFTGLPGGSRWASAFNGLGTVGRWWSSTMSTYSAFSFRLSEDNRLYRSDIEPKSFGYSIRCVKD